MATYGGARADFTGRLGADPEFGFTQGGVARIQLSVAVGTRVKNGDQYEDGETAWYRVTVWREAAEQLSEAQLTKGSTVRVVGMLRPSTYQEKLYLNVEDAEVSVVVDRFQTVTVRRVEKQQAQQQRPQSSGWGAASSGWGR